MVDIDLGTDPSGHLITGTGAAAAASKEGGPVRQYLTFSELLS